MCFILDINKLITVFKKYVNEYNNKYRGEPLDAANLKLFTEK